MLKDFDSIRTQLRDLSSVINGFKSEAVQLRLVELIFQNHGKSGTLISEEVEDNARLARKGTLSRRKNKTVEKGTSTGNREKTVKADKSKRQKTGRPGPGAMVDQLIQADFFKSHKTITDVINHCNHKMAFKYKAEELSVALARAIRNNKLQRVKNAEKQFEYWV
jgi:hypothetical protein